MNELALKAQKGNKKEYTLLFEKTQQMIKFFAKKYSADKEKYEEFLSLGLVLFCEAVRKFDISKGNFVTILGNELKYGFMTYINRNEQLVKIPAYLSEKFDKLDKYQNDFLKNENRLPTEEECSNFLGVSKKRYLNIKVAKESKSIVPIDSICNHRHLNNIEKEVINKVLIEQLLKESGLTKKEKIIIQNLYINDLEVKEIAEYYNITTQAIYNLKGKALKKMKNTFNNK